MSTTPIDTWAVDLADVTFIYPWVGSEVAMTVIAIVLWIAWHVWQVKHENKTYEEEIAKYGTDEHLSTGAGDH
jgi:hypothetical protein